MYITKYHSWSQQFAPNEVYAVSEQMALNIQITSTNRRHTFDNSALYLAYYNSALQSHNCHKLMVSIPLRIGG